MPQQLSPGITSTEKTPDIIAIEAVASDIGGMQGVAQKGPIGVATLITSPTQYVRIFGGAVAGSYLYESVMGFFANGGSRLYVVRAGHYTTISDVTSLDAAAATLQLQNAGPTNAALVSMAWRGVLGNNYSVQVIRRDTTITTTNGEIADAAVTSAVLTSTARVSIGDTLYIADATVNALRVHVTGINGNTISFASQNPSGTGTIDSGSNVVLETLDLVFFYGGTEVVRYTGLRMSSLAGPNYIENVINHPDDPEYLFSISDDAITPSGTVDPRPVTMAATALGGTTAGSDGSTVVVADIVGNSAAKNGLYAFDTKPINMLAIPGWTSATAIQGLETYVATRKFTSAIFEPPIATTVAGAVTWLTSTVNVSHDQLVCYFPWIKVFDAAAGALVTTPPSGFCMGRWASVSRRKNTAKSPAGREDGKLVGVNGIERELDTADYDTLYPVGINGILKRPTGITIMGDKTLGSTAASQKFINRRRTHNLIIQSVDEGTEWVLFENNDEETRARFTRSVQAFLLGLWRAKMLDGRKATDAFYVVCNESNNPPTLVNQGKFKSKIGARHKKSINFAEYEYESDTRAEQAELASAGL